MQTVAVQFFDLLPYHNQIFLCSIVIRTEQMKDQKAGNILPGLS